MLTELFVQHGTPKHIRSDNGPEFVAKHLVYWLDELNVKTSFITPGSPWENGYIESFNVCVRASTSLPADDVIVGSHHTT
ncbi:MAG: transposase [Chlorobi bacterium]|nr:transposase [Chlorobiota bacterium]NOG68650.1 transposase family protein [Chlorobiota bacterium]